MTNSINDQIPIKNHNRAVNSVEMPILYKHNESPQNSDLNTNQIQDNTSSLHTLRLSTYIKGLCLEPHITHFSLFYRGEEEERYLLGRSRHYFILHECKKPLVIPFAV